MDEQNDKHAKGFWGKKVSIWHIIYIVLICGVVSIFILLIAPGRINDDAYQNFSFASTLTSIVLAVVSIVYSLQSGLSTFGQLNGMKDIEAQISRELAKFSTLESSIKESVQNSIKPLEASMGSIKQQQEVFQKSQEKLANDVLAQLGPNNSVTNQINSSDGVAESMSISLSGAPQIFALILYTCLCSFETKKRIPYCLFQKFFGDKSYYCQGVVASLNLYSEAYFEVTIENNKKDSHIVAKFDSNYFGSKDYFKTLISEKLPVKIKDELLVELDNYFMKEQDENQVAG